MLSLFVFLQQEEIPFSGYQDLNAKLPEIIKNVLLQHAVDGAVKTGVLSTVIAFGIDIQKKEFIIPKQIIKGPNKNAPQTAVEGFLRKYNLQLNQCGLDEKNNIIYTIPEKMLSACDFSEILVKEITGGISKIFTQTMPTGNIEWIRPINNISAFCNGKLLQTEFQGQNIDGIPKSWEEYMQWCKEKDIIPFYEQRKAHITAEIRKIANENGFSWQDNTVNELTCLYDSPKLCLAEFPEKYLSLPQEVLRLTIEKNQRYILFYKDGQICNKICIVGKIHNQVTTSGHIKTIKARLDDASYYVSKDINSFDSHNTSKTLEKITFHQKYGSIYNRILDMQKIAKDLFPDNPELQKAIAVCKNDLNSHIVQSFTELQGYACAYYLEKYSCDSEISTAVLQHYKPLNPNDDLPKTKLGLMLSFVDKLQKINALAQVGEIPTSSRDPFAIRRDILSIIRIVRNLMPDYTVESLKLLVHSALHGFVDDRSKGI